MSEVDRYPHGALCWVDTWQPDPNAARAFYGLLFGWEFSETLLDDGDAYLKASLGGRLVAGIGRGEGPSAVWAVYVRVANIEHTVGDISRAGGRRLAGPIDLADEGRLAILTDCTGVGVRTLGSEGACRRRAVGALGTMV